MPCIYVDVHLKTILVVSLFSIILDGKKMKATICFSKQLPVLKLSTGSCSLELGGKK